MNSVHFYMNEGNKTDKKPATNRQISLWSFGGRFKARLCFPAFISFS